MYASDTFDKKARILGPLPAPLPVNEFLFPSPALAQLPRFHLRLYREKSNYSSTIIINQVPARASGVTMCQNFNFSRPSSRWLHTGCQQVQFWVCDCQEASLRWSSFKLSFLLSFFAVIAHGLSTGAILGPRLSESFFAVVKLCQRSTFFVASRFSESCQTAQHSAWCIHSVLSNSS